MDLTRYRRAQHNGSNIEVQWTGFRFLGGWRLRLLVIRPGPAGIDALDEEGVSAYEAGTEE
jgi:hypothetical protein